MSTEPSPLIKPLQFSFLIVTEHIIFPLDVRDVRETLARNAYELVPIPAPLPSRPSRVSMAGTIARKSDFIVNLDTDRNLLGLAGKSSDNILEAFDELIDVFRREMNVNLESKTKYYETVGIYHIHTRKKPSEQFSLISERMDLFKKLNEVLKTPVSTFGVRLCPKNAIPNQIEWFDIAIEPEILESKQYYSSIVFRSAKKDTVAQWASDDRKLLTKLVGVIESG